MDRGEALKERSGGGWRSGRRRSEDCWRRGHGQRVSYLPCVPISYSAPRVPQKTFSGNHASLAIKTDSWSSDLVSFLSDFLHGALKRENPVISDRVRDSGGSTEGTLGRWLAQRQAALRELLAAGARSAYFVCPCRAAYYSA